MLGRRVALVAAFLLSAAMALTAAPVQAHEGLSIVLPAPVVAPAGPVVSPAQPVSSPAAPISNDVASTVATRVGWLALLVAVAILGAASRRPRSAAALVFALLLGIFAFERGEHSVHHLGQPVQAHECAVATAASHTEAATDDGSSLLVTGLAPACAAAEVSSPRLTPFYFSAEHGRAPPAPLA